MSDIVILMIGIFATYVVSLYFGRQTNKMIEETDKLIASGDRHIADLIIESKTSTQALIASEARETRALLERLGQQK